MDYFLGIDGGGTRTTAWISDEQGRILSRSSSGPSNPLKVGFAAAQREILRAAREARRKAAAGRLEAVCLGLAGTDHAQVHRKMLAWVRRALHANRYLLTSDAAIALRAAVGDSPGIIVISGTGSIAFGRDDRGRVLRAGGWGAYLDDAGSGYDLGRKAIMAALRDYDGRGTYTQLTASLCRALRISDITQVVLKNLTPTEVAALFPLVLEAARRRDRVARQLCEEAGKDLAALAVALLRRLGWLRRVVPVVYAGGVFRSSLLIRRTVTRYLRRHAPHARILLLRHPPVEGALALARDLVQSPPSGRQSRPVRRRNLNA
jgi:N-acetylglucosamine kinase-like BadF-type ATPase